VKLYDPDPPAEPKPREDFQYFYPSSEYHMKLGDAISIVAARSEGRSIVVGRLDAVILICPPLTLRKACGVSSFVDKVRATTLKTMSPGSRLDFVETEYRPRSETLIRTPDRPRGKLIISGPVSSPHRPMGRTEKRVTFI
jgi:hypothetical protein